MDLEGWSSRLKVFADATRVRLLALLEREELTVAELSAITRLAQPRVSTHLARLKEAGLVRDRRAGVSAYYRFEDAALDPAQRALWKTLREGSDDPLLRQDAERVVSVLATRAADQNWADSVAGDMERHYSPGRTWEAMARSALPLLEPGDVLDIASGDGVLAELLAPHANRYVCLDASTKVVAAASERLRRLTNVEVHEGDMHALPFADATFDLVRADARADLRRPARTGRGRGRARAATERTPAADQPGAARTPRRRGGIRPRQPGLQREGTAEIRGQGRAGHRQLRNGDARTAPAAFRGDPLIARCNGRQGRKPSTSEAARETLPWQCHPSTPRAPSAAAALRERILVIDGAMGTMIQQHELDEAGYRGERFAQGYDPLCTADDHAHGAGCGCAHDQRGNNDLLTLTRPEIIHGIHAAYLDAGADLIETNTFNSTTVSLADYGLEHLARELNATGARLARAALRRGRGGRPGAAALRDRRARPDQPHRVAEPGRQPPGLPRDQLRRAARRVSRGRRAD